jgi:hypothetical protein
MFDRKTEITLDEQVLSLENALTIKTSELGSLAYGDQVTVDGGLYKVRHEPMRMADGLLSILLLEEVEAIIESIGLIFADTIIQSNTIITAEP